MWNLDPQPGIEPSSPVLQGKFLTTAPSGKSLGGLFVWFFTRDLITRFGKRLPFTGAIKLFWLPATNLQLICPAFFLFSQMSRAQVWPLSFHINIICFFFFFFGHTAWLAGSYLPDQGLNPRWQCKLQVLTTGPPGNPQELAHLCQVVPWGILVFAIVLAGGYGCPYFMLKR